jgi:transcription elongation factor Elf1
MIRKRTMRRVDPGDNRLCRSCGLRRAFVVESTYQKKNHYGLLVAATHKLAYCSTHGRQYAAKYKLEIPA